jgi:hypothetical protein
MASGVVGNGWGAGVVDLYWLIGAIVGSGLFIVLGGTPARRLASAVRRRDGRNRRG